MSDKSDKPKSRAGRKPKPDEDKLSEQFMVRLRKSQYERLKKLVESKPPGYELSDAVRQAIEDLLNKP